MPKKSDISYIKARQKLVRKLSGRGLSALRISKRLSKIKDGIYAASEATVLRDLKVIAKEREKWDKIHNPHRMEVLSTKREELVRELDLLIESSRSNRQFKTAGELIAKKARLLGIDKYVAPKEKKKDELEEKYANKTPEEVNDIMFQEYKDLTATLIRQAKRGKLNNIKKITVAIWREIGGKNKKFILTRFGDEKDIIHDRESIKIKENKKEEENKDEKSV